MVDTNLIEGSSSSPTQADWATMAPKLAGLVVAALLVSGGQPAAQKLPALARALVPAAARTSLDRDDLRVKDCGVSPTYPCISLFFVIRGTFASRLRLLRSQADQAGWQVEHSRPSRLGLSLELRRGVFHARYLLERTEGITGLDIYGAPNSLARPSAEERARWTNDKRRYVAQADAICSRTLGRMKAAHDLTPAVTNAARALHALRPPSGEAGKVRTFLQPLDGLVRALHSLSAAKGGDTLGAAVALGEYAKRFDRAAARYGLTRCTFH